MRRDALCLPLSVITKHKVLSGLVERLAQHKAVLLADDMGLGKTRQALAAAQRLDTDHILIVCPAGARRVWQQEIHRWVPVWDKRVVLVEPGTQVSQVQPRLSPSKPVILILSYDELSNLKSRIAFVLKLIRWDLLVLDECHYLKNPSNRTQAIYGAPRGDKGLQAYADRVILLSGTPTPNHAGEMWQHYRTFWSQALSTNGPDGAARPLTQIEVRGPVHPVSRHGLRKTGHRLEEPGDLARRPWPGGPAPPQASPRFSTELPPLQLQDIPLISTHRARRTP